MLAPLWHTATLVALYASAGIAGLVARPSASAPSSASTSWFERFVPTIAVDLVIVASLLVVGGRARPRLVLSRLVGRRWKTAPRALGDLALAVVGFVGIRSMWTAWAAIADANSTSVAALLPTTASERVAWIAFSLVVATTEELVFRGYFQAQIAARTGRPNAAWIAQAGLFGVAHLAQGVGAAVAACAAGLLLGAMTRARRSVLPALVAHAATDIVTGLAP